MQTIAGLRNLVEGHKASFGCKSLKTYARDACPSSLQIDWDSLRMHVQVYKASCDAAIKNFSSYKTFGHEEFRPNEPSVHKELRSNDGLTTGYEELR
eukprot:1142716-Pelagomonas_calceolata.AAC.1